MHSVTEEKLERICKRAVETFGKEAQLKMLFEELAELQVAVAREGRGRTSKDDIATEIADVSIMLEQIKTIYGINSLDYEAVLHEKLCRLESRITHFGCNHG